MNQTFQLQDKDWPFGIPTYPESDPHCRSEICARLKNSIQSHSKYQTPKSRNSNVLNSNQIPHTFVWFPDAICIPVSNLDVLSDHKIEKTSEVNRSDTFWIRIDSKLGFYNETWLNSGDSNTARVWYSND